jgi:acetyl esterase/lipase
MEAYPTKASILALAEIDPEFDAFLNANPVPRLPNDPAAFRAAINQALDALAPLLATVPPTLKRSDLRYTTRDNRSNRALLLQPTSPPESGSPFIFFIHGGGFISGAPEAEELFARMWVEAFGATVLLPTHRVAPEHSFPTPADDVADALDFAFSNLDEWGVDPTAGFVIGGSSAGGSLAAQLVLKCRDDVDAKVKVTGQMLVVPNLLPVNTPPKSSEEWYLSMEQNKESPIINAEACEALAGFYGAPADDWRFNPFVHPKGIEGVPRTAVLCAGMDPIRDDALIYAREAERYGVQTWVKVWKGLPHGFWMFPLEAGQKSAGDRVEALAWVLEKGVDGAATKP